MSNISDHVPVFLDVEWPSSKSTNISDTNTYHIPIPLWARATQAQIEQYQSRLDFYLSNIVIPYTSLLCKDFSCTVSSHTSDLDLFYQNIVDACVLAVGKTQRMLYLIVVSLCHKTSIHIYQVGHRSLILLENSHYSGILYGLHVIDHGRMRLLM